MCGTVAVEENSRADANSIITNTLTTEELLDLIEENEFLIETASEPMEIEAFDEGNTRILSRKLKV